MIGQNTYRPPDETSREDITMSESRINPRILTSLIANARPHIEDPLLELEQGMNTHLPGIIDDLTGSVYRSIEDYREEYLQHISLSGDAPSHAARKEIYEELYGFY